MQSCVITRTSMEWNRMKILSKANPFVDVRLIFRSPSTRVLHAFAGMYI